MSADKAPSGLSTLHFSDIRIRDPFIVPVVAEKKYYMFGTTALGRQPTIYTEAPHFDCYTGTDLVHWTGPHRVFDPPAGYWGTIDYWAAEVHHYRGKYYLFGSFKSPDLARGTDILISSTNSPLGPYLPHTENSPITPHEWECLDGTLFVEDRQPWMVFCHEWLQVQDGQICAMPLTPDLRRATAKPTLLFTASQTGWAETHNGKDYVTDGPFLHRMPSGKLIMLWSSGHAGQYAMGIATSESGKVLGPWRHSPKPLVSNDGGHGMLFRDFSGKLMLSLHRPNVSPLERPVLLTVDDSGDELRIVG